MYQKLFFTIIGMGIGFDRRERYIYNINWIGRNPKFSIFLRVTTLVVRTWCVLYILTWKCASCHNGVQCSISHLARWLRTRRFSEPTFRPSGASNHWKAQCFATLLPFRATGSSFFWLFIFLFSSLLWLFPPLLFICPYYRKFDF